MGHIRVDTLNTNNKWVGFGLTNIDMFTICVGFGLANVDTIHTLTRYEYDSLTRITTPSILHSSTSLSFPLLFSHPRGRPRGNAGKKQGVKCPTTRAVTESSYSQATRHSTR